MSDKNVLLSLSVGVFFFMNQLANAQQEKAIDYVNPFIGTDNAKAYTKWGKEGGTYPGAVAPWGYIQISPETLGSGQAGYHYTDTAIQYFSCIGHHSGFPEGSKGNIHLMPIAGNKLKGRPFKHVYEEASPGYYSVILDDDGTKMTCTATERVGLLQITFPAGVIPRLWLDDIGSLSFDADGLAFGSEYGAAFRFSMAPVKQEQDESGYVLHFAGQPNAPTVLTVWVSASPLGKVSAQKNIMSLKQELSKTTVADFSYVRRQTGRAWAKLLETITIQDPNQANKQNFYTALYHACLLPWIVSDVNGWYKGADGKPQQAVGRVQYGGFSPWDTFRSLHPLIQLLWPERQREMVQSMLAVYSESGFLPTESMTGNHAVPILVDTYKKDPDGLDPQAIYAALKGSIYNGPFRQRDLSVYHKKGFVPASMGESVTRTLEYAYDDLALSHFARTVMHDDTVAAVAERYSLSYRQLFQEETLLFIPKDEDGWRKNPGTFGYKEGDPETYSYFVPQSPQALIHLMGGDSLFTQDLQNRLTRQQLVFDNEPAFHVPYLFNYAHRPDLTQFWVHHILTKRFSAVPEGLPGNDDLGSMSSWYIFNALGFYPMAPGEALYALGTPLFESAVIHLSDGKIVQVQKKEEGPGAFYVQDVQYNAKPYRLFEISHDELMKGGVLRFVLGNEPLGDWNQQAKAIQEEMQPAIAVEKLKLSKQTTFPDDPLSLILTLVNKGARGTKQLNLLVDGVIYTSKNVLMEASERRPDTINLRLYPFGEHKLTINGHSLMVQVVPDQQRKGAIARVTALRSLPLIKAGNDQEISYRVKNIGGTTGTLSLPIQLNGQIIRMDSLTLASGDEKEIKQVFPLSNAGDYVFGVMDQKTVCKVYESAMDSRLLGGRQWKLLSSGELADETIFANKAILKGEAFNSGDQVFDLDSERYVVWKESPVLDALQTRLTMMLWIKPQATREGLVDILSKGDQHVLQLVEGKKLNFFAGGWGRGECTAAVPDDWFDHWHHVAAVCDGDRLYLYIDGQQKASIAVEPNVPLANHNRWQLGQNEEFPGERIYQGLVKDVMVFGENLSNTEINQIIGISKSSLYE